VVSIERARERARARVSQKKRERERVRESEREFTRGTKLENGGDKFLTGTDEHGQKVQRSAHKENIDPQIFVDNNAKSFIHLMNECKISNDDFIRTTELRH
jgi:hypothetical protein